MIISNITKRDLQKQWNILHSSVKSVTTNCTRDTKNLTQRVFLDKVMQGHQQVYT